VSRIKELLKQHAEETLVDRLVRLCEENAEQDGEKKTITLDRFKGAVPKKHHEEVANILESNGWDLSIAGFRKYEE
jgi:hypothetical protein